MRRNDIPFPDAIVFDLDGTLWDTNATCADAWNRVLARLAIPYRTITAADVRSVAGRPHTDGIRAVFSDLSEADVLRISEATQVEDNRAIAEVGGDVYPGVRENVPRLADLMPLLIVSNCQRGYIELFLTTSGLARRFVDFECWGNTGGDKVANVRALLERNRLHRPWLVGDTEGDAQAASENRMPFVFARYGFGEVTRWDIAIDRFADLVALLA